jgi:hypothetical protein
LTVEIIEKRLRSSRGSATSHLTPNTGTRCALEALNKPASEAVRHKHVDSEL